MVVIELKNEEEYHKLKKEKNGMLVVIFGATWCSPCQALKKAINTNLEKNYSDVAFLIVDVDKFEKISDGIKSVPYIEIFDKERKMITHFVGNNIAKIENALTSSSPPPPKKKSKN